RDWSSDVCSSDLKSSKEDGCLGEALPGDIKAQRYPKIQSAVQQQCHQLVEQHPHRQAAGNADHPDVQSLQKHQSGDVVLTHTQNIVQAQLPLSLLHKEAVDIEYEDNRKGKGHKHAHGHHHLDVVVAIGAAGGHICHSRVIDQGGHDVKGGHIAHQGENIGHKE